MPVSRRGPAVVIIGAGIVGCGVADELAQRGVSDITLVERGPWPRPGGSTSHAPGGVFQTNPSETMTRFAIYTMAQVDRLADGGQPCNHRVGSLEVATDPARWDELHRRCDWARSRGLPARLVDGAQAARLHSLLEPDRIIGAMHVASDGWVRPHATAKALAERAGAAVVDRCRVTDVISAPTGTGGHRVQAVQTDRGRLPADVVVCCAGIWGPLVGAMVGVPVPLQPLAHQYVVTGPVPGLAGGGEGVRQPFLRHQSARLYMREHGDRMGIGSYAHRPMPIEPAAIGRGSTTMPSVLPFTPDDFATSWADAVALLPVLGATEPVEGMNGIFSFTPDGSPLLGPAGELDGFWVAEAIWVTHALGAARAVAEGICGEAPTFDLQETDLDRFEPADTTAAAVRPQAVARFVEVYDIVHPRRPDGPPRGLRCSAAHHDAVALGAEMAVANGWERAQWYRVNDAAVTPDEAELGRRMGPWATRHWSPIALAEHRLGRELVGLHDMTSLRRLEVAGPGATRMLDRLTTTSVDRPPGSVRYTLLLDEHGGIRSDVTVARLDDDTYWVGTNGPADESWLARHARAEGSVSVRDITGAVCCLGLWGPVAPAVVADLADEPLDGPYFSCRRRHLGDVPVTALRVSYAGELGWELATSAERGHRLWELLTAAGAPFGLVPVGRLALDAMRMEKGYRAWGRDMSRAHSPAEAGLGWAVDLDRDFHGRPALDRRPVRRRLRTLTLDGARSLLGGEGVWHGGRPVGAVTSAAYGASVGRPIAYAWLPPELALPGMEVEIAWFGERFPARVADDALWDPDGRRLRSPLGNGSAETPRARRRGPDRARMEVAAT